MKTSVSIIGDYFVLSKHIAVSCLKLCLHAFLAMSLFVFSVITESHNSRGGMLETCIEQGRAYNRNFSTEGRRVNILLFVLTPPSLDVKLVSRGPGLLLYYCTTDGGGHL